MIKHLSAKVIKHLSTENLSAKTLNRNMPFRVLFGFGVCSVSVFIRGLFGVCSVSGFIRVMGISVYVDTFSFRALALRFASHFQCDKTHPLAQCAYAFPGARVSPWRFMSIERICFSGRAATAQYLFVASLRFSHIAHHVHIIYYAHYALVKRF
jgi:hypothetical protein